MSLRYTFRLKPDRDADLIDWLNSLGEGERSYFIRHAIRKALKQKNDSQLPNQSKIISGPTQLTDSIPQTNIFLSGDGTQDLDSNDLENKLIQLTKIF